MQNNKLISILSHFSKVEQNRLRKYITSPYFNKSNSIIQLYDFLTLKINTGNSIELGKDFIWNSIFPNKQFQDVRFRKICSDLLKLIEGFLAQEVFESKKVQQSTNLIEGVIKRKLEKLYSSSLRNAKRLTNQELHRSSNFHFYQYLIESHSYDLLKFDLQRSSKTNLEEIIDNLDHFYLTEKLKFVCSILQRKSVVSYDYGQKIIEAIKEYLNNFDLNKIPSVAVYYQIFLTLVESENEDYYFKLKDLLEEYYQLFPNDEIKEIYSYATNYCVSKANKGSKKFLQEFLDLNENLLERGIIGDDELDPWRFRNIVSAGLRLGKYNWSKEFVHFYKMKIEESYRDNAVTFNLAQIYFYEKDYQKVIELLRTVEFEDFTYNLVSKSILLATYYEEDEIEPLMSLLSSFRTYLNRNKNIPNSRRKSYLDLIKYLKKLTRIQPRDKKNLQKLKEEVESTKGIASESWLKEKIAELE